MLSYPLIDSGSLQVIIDVRNAYESDIGHFQPPPGGAKLLDPKMRNSIEFPKWLNAPQTQTELTGKNIMMYCTGGIRCERASALLDSMSEASASLKPKQIVMVRGGIERYMRTFPEGGHWKGKNFLFDKRFEQLPELKPADTVERDCESVCCRCKKPCAEYRGQHTCLRRTGGMPCKVPVIVCPSCQGAAAAEPERNVCPLCEAGHDLRGLPKPDLTQLPGLKQQRRGDDGSRNAKKPRSGSALLWPSPQEWSRAPRLHVARIPLSIDAARLRAALAATYAAALGRAPKAAVECALRVEWIYDRTSRSFYGSAYVELQSLEAASKLVEQAQVTLHDPARPKRPAKLRLSFSPPKEGEEWPAAGFAQQERPAV